ncbi:MAG: septal ring lytic transglycosylase RlpA family protein [Gammaproteobacteria bacterium]
MLQSLSHQKHLLGGCLLGVLLTACSTTPDPSARYTMRHDSAPTTRIDAQKIPDAVPRAEARSPYGNPETYVVRGKRYHVMASATGYRQRGIASWYGRKFHGHRTSSGDTYDMFAMTAAHTSLPLPTYVRVTNLDNQRQIIVKVNDRGPFHDDRIIDLSYAAAAKLDIAANGTGRVEVEAIDPENFRNEQRKQRPYALQALERSRDAAPDPRLFLQLGAFASRSNAEQLQQRITHVHPAVTIASPAQNTPALYRVRIGPLASAEEAEQLATELAQQGFRTTKIVRD